MKIFDEIRARSGAVRAVIYARFSSDLQREESIDAQVRACNGFADSNGIVIVDQYVDMAKSATTDQRPEFQRMIGDAKRSLFDVVLCHKLDRFSRNRMDSIVYRTELKRHSVHLVSVLECFDDSPEGMILESVIEAFNEYYSKNLAREVLKGQKENALQGKHTGGVPPLGYEVHPVTRKLVVNEREAEAVQLVYSLFTQGAGYGKIVDELNMRGFRTKQGQPFVKNSIHSIVRNPKYTGDLIFNRSAAKDIDGKRNGHQHKDKSEWIVMPDAIPAIISRSDFEKAQARIQANVRRKSVTTAKAVYLLSGKVQCGECGSAYVGSKRNNGSNPRRDYITYRCGKRDRKGKCHTKEMRRELLEAFVLDKLATYAFDERLVPKLLAERERYYRDKDQETMLLLEGYHRRLKEIEKEIANIVRVIGQTSSQALLSRLEELEADKVLLKSQLNKMQVDMEIPVIDEGELRRALREAKSLLLSGKLPNIKQVIETYIDKVIIYEDKVELIFKFHPDLTPPPHDDKGRGAAVLWQNSGKKKKHTQDTQFMDISCVHSGGEGGTRTVSRPKKLIKSWTI